MPYYPLSQITTNLYTNGGELFILSTGEPYIGYYYQISDGKYFTGKTPNDLPNVELSTTPPLISTFEDSYNSVIPFVKSPDDFDNANYPKYSFLNKFLPYYLPQIPTQQDYQIGEFRRYFCKKNNEYLYIEINQDQYDLLISKNPQIEFTLFTPFFIDWQLTGNKEQVARVNKNSTELIIFRNKLFGLNEYLNFNFIKYYQ